MLQPLLLYLMFFLPFYILSFSKNGAQLSRHPGGLLLFKYERGVHQRNTPN
jgi:hypothetical protein